MYFSLTSFYNNNIYIYYNMRTHMHNVRHYKIITLIIIIRCNSIFVKCNMNNVNKLFYFIKN